MKTRRPRFSIMKPLSSGQATPIRLGSGTAAHASRKVEQREMRGIKAMQSVPSRKTIAQLVHTAVGSFAVGFRARHEGEVDNPNGIINMKIHNVFIEALGEEIQYYGALVRSLDSSLGNMLEKLAMNIAGLSFEVRRNVEGPLSVEQTRMIADLLERYKRREKQPTVEDYQKIGCLGRSAQDRVRRHDSDYYLIDTTGHVHYLIELKIGGDLDNKKARSEKEAILEQFAILSNVLPAGSQIKIFFATAYNRFGENEPWRQQRVRQFFADDELLIGKDFWNFVCQSDHGCEWVSEAYRNVVSKMRFNRNNAEMSLWQSLTQYAL
ncbi:MAG TPA: TdeIII family type II restriction endonuclease [Phycisphaerae bacterium]|nr:TdeIII family type II restriction endonuclease [Phycisphaerae bacterium]